MSYSFCFGLYFSGFILVSDYNHFIIQSSIIYFSNLYPNEGKLFGPQIRFHVLILWRYIYLYISIIYIQSIYIYVYIYIYTYLSTRECMCIYNIYLCVYYNTYECVYLYLSMCMCLSVCLFIPSSNYICNTVETDIYLILLVGRYQPLESYS